jgi:1-acyl-sn-glycerol-3-phosphate acyltransferase
MRPIIIFIVRWIFRLFSHVEVVGLTNIPQQGPAILALNHMSYADPALVAVISPRRDITALVGDTYKKAPMFSWLVNQMGGIWINRQQADLGALRLALEFLSQGGLLGIAPEGTRSKVSELIPAKTGTAYLADKSGVPIVPIAISGTEIAFHQLRHFRRPRIKIEFGRPFTLPALDRKNRQESMLRNSDEIMCRIAGMLEPKYWGAYRDHPRLRELTGNL